MNISDINSVTLNNEKNLLLLRTLSFIATIFTILVGIVVYTSKYDLFLYTLVVGAVSTCYLTLFILTYTNSFIKRKPAFFLFAMYFISILGSVVSSHYNGVSPDQSWLLITCLFGVVLITRKMSHFLFFLFTILPLAIASILTSKAANTSKASIIIALALSSLTAYINLRSNLNTKRELSETENRYRILVESTLMGVFLYHDKRIIYANPCLEKILGYTMKELSNMELSNFIFPEDMKAFNTPHDSNEVSSFRISKKDGTIAYIEVHYGSIIYNCKSAVIGNVLDTTEIKKAQEQIKYMAFYDALTQLPNRHFLKDHLNNALSGSNLSSNKLCIMFIDLDNFKYINDTFGHDYGDAVLKLAAKRLQKCVSENDFVCRYGGDEFIVVLADVEEKAAKETAQNIINEFARPFNVYNQELFSSPSIGLSFYPSHGNSVEDLIKNADAAMYLAKSAGRNNYKIFRTI